MLSKKNDFKKPPDHNFQLCSQNMFFPKLFWGNGFWTFLKHPKNATFKISRVGF
jgi:hypothetical protein